MINFVLCHCPLYEGERYGEGFRFRAPFQLVLQLASSFIPSYCHARILTLKVRLEFGENRWSVILQHGSVPFAGADDERGARDPAMQKFCHFWRDDNIGITAPDGNGYPGHI